MSISFTPSQLNVIVACINNADFFQGQEYTADSYHDLRHAFVSGSGLAVQIDLAIKQSRFDARFDREIEQQFKSAVILVARAYGRFRKEFTYYRDGRCGLSSVRKYHRLLIDTLAPFDDTVEGF